MRVGYDIVGRELNIGDICNFTIKNKDYEGMIDYSEDYFAFTLEMLDDSFPSVLMSKVDLDSIVKNCSVWSTNVNEDRHKGYRELINK